MTTTEERMERTDENAERETRIKRAMDLAMARMMRDTASRLSPTLAITREQLLAEAEELETRVEER
jgi:hypothetical protein